MGKEKAYHEDINIKNELHLRELMQNLLSGNRFLLPKEGLSSHQFDWIAPYVKKIVSCYAGERIGEETRALTLILDLLSKITKTSMDEVAFDAKVFPTSAVAYSEMVVSYIIKNYRKKISVLEIAEEFGLTPNYLHAIFRRVTGETPAALLSRLRMERAAELLFTTEISIGEIAESCGFESQTYFSYVFRQRFGLTPREYRERGIY